MARSAMAASFGALTVMAAPADTVSYRGRGDGAPDSPSSSLSAEAPPLRDLPPLPHARSEPERFRPPTKPLPRLADACPPPEKSLPSLPPKPPSKTLSSRVRLSNSARALVASGIGMKRPPRTHDGVAASSTDSKVKGGVPPKKRSPKSHHGAGMSASASSINEPKLHKRSRSLRNTAFRDSWAGLSHPTQAARSFFGLGRVRTEEIPPSHSAVSQLAKANTTVGIGGGKRSSVPNRSEVALKVPPPPTASSPRSLSHKRNRSLRGFHAVTQRNAASSQSWAALSEAPSYAAPAGPLEVQSKSTSKELTDESVSSMASREPSLSDFLGSSENNSHAMNSQNPASQRRVVAPSSHTREYASTYSTDPINVQVSTIHKSPRSLGEQTAHSTSTPIDIHSKPLPPPPLATSPSDVQSSSSWRRLHASPPRRRKSFGFPYSSHLTSPSASIRSRPTSLSHQAMPLLPNTLSSTGSGFLKDGSDLEWPFGEDPPSDYAQGRSSLSDASQAFRDRHRQRSFSGGGGGIGYSIGSGGGGGGRTSLSEFKSRRRHSSASRSTRNDSSGEPHSRRDSDVLSISVTPLRPRGLSNDSLSRVRTASQLSAIDVNRRQRLSTSSFTSQQSIDGVDLEPARLSTIENPESKTPPDGDTEADPDADADTDLVSTLPDPLSDSEFDRAVNPPVRHRRGLSVGSVPSRAGMPNLATQEFSLGGEFPVLNIPVAPSNYASPSSAYDALTARRSLRAMKLRITLPNEPNKYMPTTAIRSAPVSASSSADADLVSSGNPYVGNPFDESETEDIVHALAMEAEYTTVPRTVTATRKGNAPPLPSVGSPSGASQFSMDNNFSINSRRSDSMLVGSGSVMVGSEIEGAGGVLARSQDANTFGALKGGSMERTASSPGCLEGNPLLMLEEPAEYRRRSLSVSDIDPSLRSMTAAQKVISSSFDHPRVIHNASVSKPAKLLGLMEDDVSFETKRSPRGDRRSRTSSGRHSFRYSYSKSVLMPPEGSLWQDSGSASNSPSMSRSKVSQQHAESGAGAGGDDLDVELSDGELHSLESVSRDPPAPGDHQVSIQVIGARLRTMFQKTFAEYKLRVQIGELAWMAQRRFSEFVTLRKEVREFLIARTAEASPTSSGSSEMSSRPNSPKNSSDELYALRNLPSLPRKTIFRKVDDAFVEARREELHLFLQALLALPGVSTSRPLLTFCGALQDFERADAELQEGSHMTHMQVERFIKVAKTGDIVLFHTLGILQSGFRAATSSLYDHVGLVVYSPESRSGHKRLSLLEATGDGVQIYPLEPRLYLWDQSGAKLAARRLHTELTEQQLESLDGFVSQAVGKKYGVSPLDYLRKRAACPEERKKFFCSELLAECYKALGLLPEDATTNRYYPATFSDAHNTSLKLLGDATLSTEYRLDFAKPAVQNATNLSPFSSNSRFRRSRKNKSPSHKQQAGGLVRPSSATSLKALARTMTRPRRSAGGEPQSPPLKLADVMSPDRISSSDLLARSAANSVASETAVANRRRSPLVPPMSSAPIPISSSPSISREASEAAANLEPSLHPADNGSGASHLVASASSRDGSPPQSPSAPAGDAPAPTIPSSASGNSDHLRSASRDILARLRAKREARSRGAASATSASAAAASATGASATSFSHSPEKGVDVPPPTGAAPGSPPDFAPCVPPYALKDY